MIIMYESCLNGMPSFTDFVIFPCNLFYNSSANLRWFPGSSLVEAEAFGPKRCRDEGVPPVAGATGESQGNAPW